MIDYNSNSMTERTNYLPQYQNFKSWTSKNSDPKSGKQWVKVLDLQLQAAPQNRPQVFQFAAYITDVDSAMRHTLGQLKIDAWPIKNYKDWQFALNVDRVFPYDIDPKNLFNFVLYYKPHGDDNVTVDVQLWCQIIYNFAALTIQPYVFRSKAIRQIDSWKYNINLPWVQMREMIEPYISQDLVTENEKNAAVAGFTAVTADALLSLTSNDTSNSSTIQIYPETSFLQVASYIKDSAPNHGQKTINRIVPVDNADKFEKYHELTIVNFNNVILQSSGTINDIDASKMPEGGLALPDNKAYQMRQGEAVTLLKYKEGWLMR